jgi:hypothetical protein
MISVWLTSPLDSGLVVLKRMNVGDVVLPGLVKHDRMNNAVMARFGHWL